jgi:hypothetical protein
METQNYNNDKLEFRQIVLGHIKRILELSSHELRDTTYTITHANFSETKYQEDTRFSYIQAIENLAFVLMPYFDDEMLKVYEGCVGVINAYEFQIEKIYQEEIKLILKELGNESINVKPYCLDKKIECAKELFIALNMLLKRNDYLKSAVYGEDKDEVVSDDEESEVLEND